MSAGLGWEAAGALQGFAISAVGLPRKSVTSGSISLFPSLRICCLWCLVGPGCPELHVAEALFDPIVASSPSCQDPVAQRYCATLNPNECSEREKMNVGKTCMYGHASGKTCMNVIEP